MTKNVCDEKLNLTDVFSNVVNIACYAASNPSDLFTMRLLNKNFKDAIDNHIPMIWVYLIKEINIEKASEACNIYFIKQCSLMIDWCNGKSEFNFSPFQSFFHSEFNGKNHHYDEKLYEVMRQSLFYNKIRNICDMDFTKTDNNKHYEFVKSLLDLKPNSFVIDETIFNISCLIKYYDVKIIKLFFDNNIWLGNEFWCCVYSLLEEYNNIEGEMIEIREKISKRVFGLPVAFLAGFSDLEYEVYKYRIISPLTERRTKATEKLNFILMYYKECSEKITIRNEYFDTICKSFPFVKRTKEAICNLIQYKKSHNQLYDETISEEEFKSLITSLLT